MTSRDMPGFMQDVRYSIRMLWKSRGVTAIAIMALALGIGANSAMYSLADVLLMRPLLLPDIDRAVNVWGVVRGTTSTTEPFSPANIIDLRAQVSTLERLAAFTYTSMALTGAGDPVRIDGAVASADLFPALRGSAELGRTFTSGEEQPGRDRVVVLSHSLWDTRFASDPRILHRTVKLNGAEYQVVGVMPREFRFPAEADFWIPLALTPVQRAIRDVRSLGLIGRLKDGVSIEQANAEVQAITHRLESDYPVANAKLDARVIRLREVVSGELTASYTRMLLGAVWFVLLIACANVANLQFARVSMRSREFAVRTALGARRWIVVRQILVESALLGIGGGLIGVFMAAWNLEVFKSLMSPEVERHLPGWSRLAINPHVLAYTAVIAVAAGILSGLAPALFASRGELAPALKENSRSTSAGRGRRRLRSALVICEISLALVLLVGAGLTVSGLQQINDPRPNIAPEQVLTFRAELPKEDYATPQQRSDFDSRVLDGLKTIAGAGEVAMVTNLAYADHSESGDFRIAGRPPARPNEQPRAQKQAVSPGWFGLLRIPISSGRAFTPADGKAAPRVAVISERLARLYFASEDPVGKRIRFDDGDWSTIVGVAGDILHNPYERVPRAVIYQPYPQAPGSAATFLIRTGGDPLRLAPAARAKVAEVDPNLPVSELANYRKIISDQLLGFRDVVIMMTGLGIIALLLSAVGVYGLVAFAVAERTHEIGVRIALGAGARDVAWMVSRWGLALTGAGLAIGLPLSFALARLLSGLLFGVSAYHAASFLGGIGVLSAAAMLACWVPVRRAVLLDPIETLRNE